ncbi:hypothetical protein [Pseudomonas sp.]|uniref:hypothetical protein n=1 Tax=Pseudomonas sp. TaxID=306 RepID=UPI0035242CA1
MATTKGKVIHLYQRDPQEALERLNRITGLRFSSWPQSLVPLVEQAQDAQTDTEPTPAETQAGGSSR